MQVKEVPPFGKRVRGDLRTVSCDFSVFKSPSFPLLSKGEVKIAAALGGSRFYRRL
jgi:hypothetical protein